jgi:hypothetical protein
VQLSGATVHMTPHIVELPQMTPQPASHSTEQLEVAGPHVALQPPEQNET